MNAAKIGLVIITIERYVKVTPRASFQLQILQMRGRIRYKCGALKHSPSTTSFLVHFLQFIDALL